MTKAGFTREIARVLEISQKEAQLVLEAILDSIIRALRSGDRVELRGFGTFETHTRASRVGRIPRTQAKVDVPARRVPTFRPSKELKALLGPSKDRLG